MEAYDIVMLAVLVLATLFGLWKGLAWQVASLASIVVSYLVALKFSDSVATFIKTAPPWNKFAAMLLLYVGTSLVIWIIFRWIANIIDRVKLKEFDRQIGAMVGFAKGVILCVIITLFAVSLSGESSREAICNSRSGHYIAMILSKAHTVMPDEIHEVVHPYIHSFDDRFHSHREATSADPVPAGVESPSLPDQLDHAGGELQRNMDQLIERVRESAEAVDKLREAVR